MHVLFSCLQPTLDEALKGNAPDLQILLPMLENTQTLLENTQTLLENTQELLVEANRKLVQACSHPTCGGVPPCLRA